MTSRIRIRGFMAAAIVLAIAHGAAFSSPSRDPFRFAEDQPRAAARTKTRKAGPPHVEMILIQGDRKLAVIDGRGVRVGDSLNGAVVTGITIDSVTLEGNGRTSVLPLQPETGE